MTLHPLNDIHADRQTQARSRWLIGHRRTDLPKANVILAPIPGRTYANGGAEQYGSLLAGIGSMVTDILTKAGRTS